MKRAILGGVMVAVSIVCACGGDAGESKPMSCAETSWTPCATEGAVCAFTGTMDVRYGANLAYVYKTATGSIACDNTTFGSDPAYGTKKACSYAPTGCAAAAGTKSSSGSSGAALCSPKSGSCKSASDCACGQSCYPTAVCSTCEKRCNFSCQTDQDCVNATKNTTSPRTHCVKTSPGYAIYACE